MNYFPIQAILIADIGDQGSSVWIQIFVLLIFGFSWWVFSLVKNNRTRHKDRQQDLAEDADSDYAKSHWRFQFPHKPAIGRKSMVQEYIASRKNPENKSAAEKNKDLQSGMELLELNFLLSIIENAEGNSQKDVIMRKLNFNEVHRRKKLGQVNSKAIKVYAINRGNLYGKDIQCQAMAELSERTTRMNRHKALQPAEISDTIAR